MSTLLSKTGPKDKHELGSLSGLFQIRQTKTHGLGWVATTNIRSGTSILDEPLLFKIPTSKTSDEEFISGILHDQLDDQQRDSFMNLYGKSIVHKLKLNGHPLNDFDKDPMGLTTGIQRPYLGIYPCTARLNHSCRPNAVRVCEQDHIMSIVAQTDIAKDEEITVSYLHDIFLTKQERFTALQITRPKDDEESMSEGSCLCETCRELSNDPQKEKESDERRKQMAGLRDLLLRDLLPKERIYFLFMLMKQEGLITTSLGPEATIKMMSLLYGKMDMSNPQTFQTESYKRTFNVGEKVSLHKLRMRPELNGKFGIIVKAFDSSTGRVAVRLLDENEEEQSSLSYDQSINPKETTKDENTATAERNKPLAIKPENLLIVPDY